DISATKPKPSGDLSSESLKALLENFASSMEQVRERVTQEVRNRNSRSKLSHPWFGPLSAREWNWLLATHQRIHRRQIEEIQKHYLGR
ncbi:DinB family protein, partial [bacterium]|nr:DinB family protein [bacterium]